MMRRTWIDKGDTVALTWQCALAGVSRSAVYARQKPKPIALDDEVLKRLIDEEYTRHPFYGSHKMVVYLGRCGHCVNRKRAQRLMRTLGLAGMAPGPNTPRVSACFKSPRVNGDDIAWGKFGDFLVWQRNEALNSRGPRGTRPI
ncbi:Mobile element protein [Polaromonas sp. CG9_12]|nr:Mobile element protein [Polaromonas sp. CG9_12]